MSAVNEPSALAIPDGIPQLLRDLVHERIGIFFESDRFDTLLDKLRDRVLHHGFRSYLEYFYLLKYDEKGRDEWLRVMDAFSVQETYFWREAPQIRTLVTTVAPRWFERHSTPLRIWSAACASGEEPYSIAIALIEAGMGDQPFEIIASDASEAALTRARAGLYRERSFRALPEPLRSKYFSSEPEGWRLVPEVRARISFRQANLAAPAEISGLATAQVIYCRNVFIYFSPAAIRRTLAVFAEQIPDGGHLFVGASESLLKLTSDFDLQEIGDAFVYVRKPRDASP